MRRIFLLSFLSLLVFFAQGQVDVTASGGTPAASYTTLKGAFDAINAGTHTGTIAIGISGNTTETATAQLNGATASYTSLSISPTGGVTRTISGSLALPLIELSDADNVTIDGLNSGGNSLTIVNNSASATAGTSTIRFINDATSNAIYRCTIQGASASSASNGAATIIFGIGKSGGSGNDNNIIQYCDIGDNGSNTPFMAIMCTSITNATANDNNQIRNCNIYNFFSATTNTFGMSFSHTAPGLAASNWIIDGNSFYQTATRTTTSGATLQYSFIAGRATQGISGFTISNNYFGGSTTSCGGAAMSVIQGGAGTLTFRGLDMNCTASVVTTIQNNYFQNFSLTTSSGSTALSMIILVNGRFDIGGASGKGNLIGSTTGNSITINHSTNSGANFSAITAWSGTTSIGDSKISYNTIAGINVVSTLTITLRPIWLQYPTTGAITYEVSNNIVGSETVSNSIISNSPGAVNGIYISGSTAPATATYNNNTISNLTSSNASASLAGINFANTTVTIPLSSVSNNTIRNLSGAGTSYVAGIYINPTTSGGFSGTPSIASNNIRNLKNTNTGSSAAVYGIYFSTSGASAVSITSNTIDSLNSAGNAVVAGVYVAGSTSGTGNIQSNSIRRIWNSYSGATTGAQVIGVYANPSSALNVLSNSLTNLVNSGPTTGSTTSSSVIGISHLSTLYVTTTSNNTVDSLSNTNGGAGTYGIIGIYASGAANSACTKNKVHSFLASSTAARLYGIQIGGTITTLANNMIRVGLDQSGNSVSGDYDIRGINASTGVTTSIYYNSVYIGGTNGGIVNKTYALDAGNSLITNIRNNILVNRRTVASSNMNIAFNFSTSITATNISNNLYWADTSASGGGNIARNNGTGYYNRIAQLQALTTGRDNNSVSSDPKFVNPTGNGNTVDLHIQTGVSTEVESGAYVLDPTITDDIDADIRQGSAGYTPGSTIAPDIGADELNATLIDITAPLISYTALGNQSGTSAPTLNVAISSLSITDLKSGVNNTLSNSTAPRLYYKKCSDANVINDNTNATSGWKWVESNSLSLTPDYSLLPGSVGAGSIINYFVVAQDNAATPNVGISNNLSFASAPSSVALSTANLPASGFQSYVHLITGGTINVGTSGTVPNITGACGCFNVINASASASVITSAPILSITSDITEDNTYQLTNSQGFLVTIQPDAATLRTISGTVSDPSTASTSTSYQMIGVSNTGTTSVRLKIDGRFAGSGRYLLFRNTSSTPANAAPVIFGRASSTGAITVDLNYAIFEGNNQYATPLFGAHIINIVTSNSSSNTLNIDNCIIRNATGGTTGNASGGIFINSSTAATTITNNAIDNIFNTPVQVYLSSTATISANSIYASSSTLTSSSVYSGILVGGNGGTTYSVTNNYIGGSAVNCGGSAMSSSNSTITFKGISQISTAPSNSTTISGNTISNISLVGTGASSCYGISVTSGLASISSNTISTISSSSSSTSRTVSAALAGIESRTSTAGMAITGNTITDLTANYSGSGADSVFVIGIAMTSPGSNSANIKTNKIYGLKNQATGLLPRIYGMFFTVGGAGGTPVTVANNMISLNNNNNTSVVPLIAGIRDEGSSTHFNNYYYNSVYIWGSSGGSGSGNSYAFSRYNGFGTGVSLNLANNAFVNERQTGTGKHYAISNVINNATPSTGWTSSTNNLLFSLTPSTLGLWGQSTGGVNTGGTDRDSTAWVGVSAGDLNSVINDTLTFIDPATGNLHTTDFSVVNMATTIASVTDDYDAQSRNGACGKDIGADEIDETSIGTANTWLGTTSADWCTSCNWSKATVPVSTQDVVIPARTKNALNINTNSCPQACNSFTINANATMTLTTNGTLNVYGDFTNNGGFNNTGTGTLAFRGAVLQTINSTSTLSIVNLTMDNGSGGSVTLNADANVSGTLALTNGIITVNTGKVFAFTPTATYTGGSNSSYVNGKMRQIVNNGSTSITSFTLPVGKSGFFGPVGASNLTGTAANDYFDGEYFQAYPGNIYSVNYNGHNSPPNDPPVYHASMIEYWNLVPNNTSISGNPTLYFPDKNRSVIYDKGNDSLRVLVYNSSQWFDLSNSNSNAQETVAGAGSSITSLDNASTFGWGKFTFGTTQTNPGLTILPSRIKLFEALKQTGYNNLHWEVSCTGKELTFELQRSYDGRNFSTISSFTAQQSRCGQPFDYRDYNAFGDKIYYRIRITDENSKVMYTHVALILNKQSGVQVIGLLQNPVSSEIVVNISSPVKGKVEFIVTDMLGKLFIRQTAGLNAGSNLVRIPASRLAAGIYNLVLVNEPGNSLRVLKQ